MAKLILQAENKEGKVLWIKELNEGVYTLGRDINSDVMLKGELVSRKHARIAWENNCWLLTDLGSSHGVFVNGAKTQKTMLSGGAVLTIGDVFLRVQTRDVPNWNPVVEEKKSERPVRPEITESVGRHYGLWLFLSLALTAAHAYLTQATLPNILTQTLAYQGMILLVSLVFAGIAKLKCGSFFWKFTHSVGLAAAAAALVFDQVAHFVLFNNLPDSALISVATAQSISITLITLVFWTKLFDSLFKAIVPPMIFGVIVLLMTIQYQPQVLPPKTLLLYAESKQKTADFEKAILDLKMN